eukprot:14087366-Alexandrium_andersonii.AAC.1
MSASLVGSEMCIRDRCILACARRRGHRGRPLVGGGWRSGPFVDLNPVSYTHLTLPTICSV